MPIPFKRIFQEKTFYITILSITLISVIAWTISSQINRSISSEQISQILNRFGPLTPLVFILLCAATNIFSPLAIMPLWIAGIVIFEPPWSFLYLYLANLLGHSLNFIIAKKWGRQIIQRLVGESGLEKVNRFSDLVDIKTIFLIRLLGGGVTDYVSYALGLTSLTFPAYLIISAITFLPWIYLNHYLIQQAIGQQLTIVLRNFGLLALLGYLTTLAAIYLGRRNNPPAQE